ncbi:hypothetical protein [Pseudomonas putida]|uniref:hypothetical protein n=1 Tax=Pseudomonas putida TaxID=303 RepID=UPI0012D2BC47|nr:hypothetical protein [Pseudomonas putida]
MPWNTPRSPATGHPNLPVLHHHRRGQGAQTGLATTAKQPPLAVEPYPGTAGTDNQHICVARQLHMAVKRLVVAGIDGLGECEMEG